MSGYGEKRVQQIRCMNCVKVYLIGARMVPGHPEFAHAAAQRIS